MVESLERPSHAQQSLIKARQLPASSRPRCPASLRHTSVYLSLPFFNWPVVLAQITGSTSPISVLSDHSLCLKDAPQMTLAWVHPAGTSLKLTHIHISTHTSSGCDSTTGRLLQSEVCQSFDALESSQHHDHFQQFL
ncbi:uncharacterized [Tachysurus ichikawai]